MHKNKGITLIALVITIIVLLILAGISIQAITHTGIFDSAKQAELENKRGQVTEYLNLKLLNQQMLNSLGTAEEIITATRATIKQTELEQIGKKAEIGEISREEDFKQVEIYFYVTVDDDLYKVELNGVNFIGNKKEMSPAIRIKKLSNTTSSITVEVETQNNTGGIIEYYIKKEDGEYNCIETTTEKSYTYKNLEQGKKYTIKVVAVAENKKTGVTTVEKTIGEIEQPEIGICTPTTWTAGNVTVTLPTKEGFTTRYTTDGTVPTTSSTAYNGPFTVSSNCTIIFVYSDGTNVSKETQTANVINIDKTAPSTFTISKLEVGVNSFTLSATFEDDESGLGKIEWYYKGTQDSSWQKETEIYTELNGSTKGTTGSVTKIKEITGLTQGETVEAYAVGYDVAGNSKTASSVFYIPITNIILNKNTTTILKGTDETLIANVEPDNATNKEVEWSSSNEAVATVENGIVKALSEGTTIIKATSKYDNEMVGSCTVTVRNPTTEEIIDIYGEEIQSKSEYGKNNAGYASSVTVTLDLGEGTWGICAPTSGVGVSRTCNFGEMDKWYIITIPAGSTRRLTATASWSNTKEVLCGAFIQYRKLNLD